MSNSIYLNSRVAIDVVIFTILEEKPQVLLLKRHKEPFQGKLELPGGLLIENETAEQTLQRKLGEITNTNNTHFNQFHTFTNPVRDPRGRTISIGFLALVNSEKMSSDCDWHDVNNLPELAFDHAEIIQSASKYLKENLNLQFLKSYMPIYFPLNSLQTVYEVIHNEKYDNRNFRKQQLASENIVETDKLEKDVKHRPAKLYRFKE